MVHAFLRPRLRLVAASAAAFAAASWTAGAEAAPETNEPVSLEQAVDIALHQTTRARLIDGDLDIAQQTYRAKRLNFYLPTISINGAVPSYDVDQSYRFFGGSNRKQLYKTSDLGFTSFIKLEQALFTGGNLTMTANLAATKNRYPDTDPLATPDSFLNERSDRGYFDFAFEQPLLKPSVARNDLADKKDDLKLAELTQLEEQTKLRGDVTSAYMDLLLAQEEQRLLLAKLELARLTAAADSAKWQDAVLTREDWLASSLARLDAELEYRDAQAQSLEAQRTLALLLDTDPGASLQLSEPIISDHPSTETQQQWVRDWEESIAVRKARAEAAKARRSAHYATSGKGFTGDFRATYSHGRGEVRLDGRPDEPIRTEGWGVSLSVSYPLWDGGASTAAAEAAHSEAERAELTLSRALQDARASLLGLANAVSVGHRRMEILRSQIELASESVSIDQARFADGRIARDGLLTAQIQLSQARTRYLSEMKTYLTNRIALEGSFAQPGL